MLKIEITIKSFHLKTLNLAILNIYFFFLKKFKKLHFMYFRKAKKKLEVVTILKAPKINKSARNQLGKYTYKSYLQLKFALKKKNEYTIIIAYLISLILCKLNIMYINLSLKKMLVV